MKTSLAGSAKWGSRSRRWGRPLALWAAVILLGGGTAGMATENSWPRLVETSGGQIKVFQPQWEDARGAEVVGRAVVAVTSRGQDEPVFGLVWLKARRNNDAQRGLVRLDQFRLTAKRFPPETDPAVRLLADALDQEAGRWEQIMPVDQFLSALEEARREQELAGRLETRPPRILYTATPAALVIVDGEPELRVVPGSDLLRVANTPFLILFEPKGKRYFLKGGPFWYAAGRVEGPWQPLTEPPPAEVLAVATAEAEEEASAEGFGATAPPEVIVSLEPAELISTRGEPRFKSLSGTDLLYVSNTDRDLFLDLQTQQYYLLLAGRWYRSGRLTGPWTFVPAGELPADFARIRSGSEKGHVLASVPGTEAAQEAVRDAQVPRTTAVRRDEASVEVSYDGEPRFEPVQNTRLQYAVNTEYKVLRLDNRYYCCHEGVWYESASPHGPWEICTDVPREVRWIPPDHPLYPVKYVYVYDSTPEVVYVGYTPSYLGAFYYDGCVVYGTGYHYRPWVGRVCYSYPWTWGLGVSYWSGRWAVSVGWAGCYGWGCGSVCWGWCYPRWWYRGWWGCGGYAEWKYKYVHKTKYVTKNITKNVDKRFDGTSHPSAFPATEKGGPSAADKKWASLYDAKREAGKPSRESRLASARADDSLPKGWSKGEEKIGSKTDQPQPLAAWDRKGGGDNQEGKPVARDAKRKVDEPRPERVSDVLKRSQDSRHDDKAVARQQSDFSRFDWTRDNRKAFERASSSVVEHSKKADRETPKIGRDFSSSSGKESKMPKPPRDNPPLGGASPDLGGSKKAFKGAGKFVPAPDAVIPGGGSPSGKNRGEKAGVVGLVAPVLGKGDKSKGGGSGKGWGEILGDNKRNR